MRWSLWLAALTANGLYTLHSSGAQPAQAPRGEEVRPDVVRQRTASAPAETPAEPVPVPPAPDKLGGHVQFGASLGWAVPFAKLGSGLKQGDVMSSGPGVGVDVGLGVSRSLVIALWGQAAFIGSADTCRDCRTTSWAGGPWVRFHLAQGVRFDPWIGAGLGWRTTTVRTNRGESSYSGPEWFRVVVGADWYPTRSLGMGPILEFATGTYTHRPTTLPVPRRPSEPMNEGTTSHWQFVAGLRVVFDVPGK